MHFNQDFLYMHVTPIISMIIYHVITIYHMDSRI